MSADAGVLRVLRRAVVLFIETGPATLLVSALAVFVTPNTWFWDLTKGGNRTAWLIPVAIIAAFFCALKERHVWIKRFSLGFHALFVLLVVAVIAVNWFAPGPD